MKQLTLCPACRQSHEKYAMGVIELHTGRQSDHSDQLWEAVQGTERIARRRNDQERILWQRSFRGVTKIYVTLPELARAIGRTLQRTFEGKTEYYHSPEESFLRVIWRSPESVDDSQSPRRRSHHWRRRGRSD